MFYNKISDILNQIKRVKTRADKMEALRINKDNLIFKKILQYTYTDVFGNKYYPVKKFEPKVVKNELSIDHNFDIIDSLFVLLTINKYISHDMFLEINNILESFDKTSQDIVNMMLNRDLECGIDEKMLEEVFGYSFK